MMVDEKYETPNPLAASTEPARLAAREPIRWTDMTVPVGILDWLWPCRPAWPLVRSPQEAPNPWLLATTSNLLTGHVSYRYKFRDNEKGTQTDVDSHTTATSTTVENSD